MKFGLLVGALVFPSSHVAKILIIPQGLVLLGLECLVEMPAARFLPSECVRHHQFTVFHEIRYPAGPFQALVEVFVLAGIPGVSQNSDRNPRIMSRALASPSLLRDMPQ